MAEAGMDKDMTIQAARILLTLKNRRLLRFPEWVQKESAAPAVAAPEIWGNRKRRGQRGRGGRQPELDLTSSLAGSVPSSSGEDRSPAPQQRWMESPPRDEPMAAVVRRPDTPRPCGAPAGSGQSTSTDRTDVVEAAAKASASPVSASVASPETPLEFVTASSSGDDTVSPTSKRNADEGCSSPAKQPRVSAGDGENAISEPKMQQAPDPDGKAVKHGFDLNMLPEDEEESVDGSSRRGFC